MRKTVLISLGIGAMLVIIYNIICVILILLFVPDLERARYVPAFDIGLRLPTMLIKYLFPEATADFYRPGFRLPKLVMALSSFLLNVAIYAVLPYLVLTWRGWPRSKAGLNENAPPPPPTFDN